MKYFETFVEVLIVLLGIGLVIAIFKFPRDVFIRMPLGILSIISERTLWVIKVVFSPVWIPLWFLDQKFKWGIFEHRLFRIFDDPYYTNEISEEKPEREYESTKKLEVNLEQAKIYLISNNQNTVSVKRAIIDGLETAGKNYESIIDSSSSKYTLILISGIALYDFHFLIQWLDNEFSLCTNFGYISTPEISFFGLTDRKTLNNVIGKTSEGEAYSFNLVSGQIDYLGINNKIRPNKNLTIDFFETLVDVSAGNNG